MSFVQRLRGFLFRPRPRPLGEWFQVEFDEETIRIQAEPPGRPRWSQELTWDSIEKIVFEAEELYISDGIYLFSSQRPESYAVPTEATGGIELWEEILRRGLFDPELAIEAATAARGTFSWPPA